jgi:lysophospholipase L1-like esterase
MEVLLHHFSGKIENGAGKEVRNYREGLAQAHFLPDWRRVTGNPQIPGAPTMLILGDSHVEALQVNDQETMGSVLERRLRAEGQSCNVQQYGWSGADGPDYVFEAPLVARKFPAKRIFLVMNGRDFLRTTTDAVRLVERGGQVLAEATGPDSVMGHDVSYGRYWARKMKESGLIYAVSLRMHLDIMPRITEQKASAQVGDAAPLQVSRDSVNLILRGLQEAYGDRLYILYTPRQPFSAHPPLEPPETMLMAECQTLGMACRTLRARMVDDLITNHHLARGFVDTQPGEGHLNTRGHELVAAELADWLHSPR